MLVRIYASLLLALAAFVCPVYADGMAVMRGEIQNTDLAGGRVMVELVDSNGGQLIDRAMVHPSGAFELHNVPNRTCEFRVITDTGELLRKDFLVPTQVGVGFTIDLAGLMRRKERPVSGLVSARRLAHKIPKAAMKEFRKAENATANRKDDEAIQHLEKAVELDPEFMEALNNLGTKYIRMGRPAEAAELFQRATALDPSLPQLHVNLAVALLHLRRPAEAEQEVRKALTGQTDGNPMAKKILGISLAAQGKAAFAPR